MCRLHGLAQRVFGADVGVGCTCAHRDGYPRMHQIGFAVGVNMAGGDEFVDSVRRQHDKVKGLTRLHTPGGIHTTHGFDGDHHIRLLLVCSHQVGQHLPCGHG